MTTEEVPAKRGYKKERLKWGSVRRSGRSFFQASYPGPDGARHNGPTTYSSEATAKAWLERERELIEADLWTPPAARAAEKARSENPCPTVEEYAIDWLESHNLHTTTRTLYTKVLTENVLPDLGELMLTEVDIARVRKWHADQRRDKTAKRTLEQAYSTFRAMMQTAEDDGLITQNPCRLKKVIKSASKKAGAIMTAAELDAAGEAMCTVDDQGALRAAGRDKAARSAARGIKHPEWRALVLLSGWCALRTGELQALVRGDIDLRRGVVHIERAAYYERPDRAAGTEGSWHLGPVKGEGERTVTIPPHIVPALEHHLEHYVGARRDDYVFLPAAKFAALRKGGDFRGDPETLTMLASSTVHSAWKRALAMAGAPDMPFHNLRHTGATLASRAGATTAEVMQRLGHSTPRTALIYQHSTKERQESIARQLSALDDA